MADLTDPIAVHDQLSDLQIVDVREQYEWDAGHIDGAAHVVLNDLMGGAGTFEEDKPVVAVCRSGNRSELATLMLKARGLDAYNMEGGMEAWDRANLPFSASDGTAGSVA